MLFFFFSSRRRHTRSDRDWSSDVCSSDLAAERQVRRVALCRRILFGEELLELTQCMPQLLSDSRFPNRATFVRRGQRIALGQNEEKWEAADFAVERFSPVHPFEKHYELIEGIVELAVAGRGVDNQC